MAAFNAIDFERKFQEALRAKQEIKREIDRVNRANKKAVDDYNRKAEAHNRKVVSDYNARVRQQNERTTANNRKIVAELNRQLRSTSSHVRYTEPEQRLADRVHVAVASLDPREYDTFLSYARIDGVRFPQFFCQSGRSIDCV